MDIYLWLMPVVIMLLLLLSALFSSLESAYFSLNRTVVEKLGGATDKQSRQVFRMLSNPRRLLATILTGNTVVNTSAAALAALWTIRVAELLEVNPMLAVGIEVAILTGLILIFAELIPKLMALRNAELWALNTSSITMGFWYMLSPFTLPLSFFTESLSKFFGVEQHKLIAMSDEEIRSLVQVGHERGELELEERKMIHSIVEFGDTIVREVMVPRIDIISLEKTASRKELLDLIIENGHSRIPVYEDSIDNVIGLIHGKDLLKVVEKPEEFDIMALLRPAYFIPEEKPIDNLLREFQSQHTHMAIVVDEYGGTAGLVTLEDIIEEIFGEIQDEYDKETPMITIDDDGAYIANALIGIDDFNEEVGIDILPDSEAYESLGGFIYSQMGVVPNEGEDFNYEGYRFIVEEVDGKRITKVRVVKDKRAFDGA